MKKLFPFEKFHTSLKKELLAGATSFFTVSYIIIVNPLILKDAGIPLTAAIFSTIVIAILGCLLIGFYANVPLILTPGMGINAFFVYTIVQGNQFTWKAGFAVVFVAGCLFVLLSITSFGKVLSQAIPASLKHGITSGIGLFLTFIGLQKGGIITADSQTFVKMGDLTHPTVLLTLFGFLIMLILYLRKIPGSFLIGIFASTVFAWFLGVPKVGHTPMQPTSLQSFFEVVGSIDFSPMVSWSFWTATFSLTIILVFETIGLLESFLPDSQKFQRAFQSSAFTALFSGMIGSSPTVVAAESASGISEGGRTGLTAVTVGSLFAISLFAIPLITMIPESVTAPVLIIIGGIMFLGSIRHIAFDDFAEGFSSFLIIALIPLTYSIADGLAFGFIAYPFLKWVEGKGKVVSPVMYVIAGLFLLNYLLSV